jgi:threonine dehydratase
MLQIGKVESVCTHSSGNHAQALAYAAATLGIPAYIVMPQNSPVVKKKAVQGYGATIIESGNTLK